MAGEHRTVAPVDDQARRIVRSDPALQLVGQATSEQDLIDMVTAMGIADPQHNAMMLGLLKLAWIQIRKPL